MADAPSRREPPDDTASTSLRTTATAPAPAASVPVTHHASQATGASRTSTTPAPDADQPPWTTARATTGPMIVHTRPFRVCFSYTPWRARESRTRDSTATATATAPATPKHVTVSLRRDPCYVQRHWWNFGEGLYFERTTNPDRWSKWWSTVPDPTVPSKPRSVWHNRPDDFEVHLGDVMLQAQQRAATHLSHTFGPPLDLCMRYARGFVDGTHLSVLAFTAAMVANGAPWRTGKRMIEMWARPESTPPPSGSSSSSSSSSGSGPSSSRDNRPNGSL
ncbi:hypothetical protein AMAG_04339 [Allomyces macrogynus ATCC 38327]|uniref:Uncharacterized protein n=1 Tax=Allomyces macrogynus (strain ATCC 38327) TaxID=578462 RepID=A0A0L0S857_ALLM3|nr:hypothetical protein AMAG_04339 [Allomyces macrogynus ATCC 38327]|eukprot:KNE58788.1 hypothetical protein AMAG_04339 [Allomyces macrogynus ATCC 38327]